MAQITATERRRLGPMRPETYMAALALLQAAQDRAGMVITFPPDGGFRLHARQQILVGYKADSIRTGGGSYAVAPVGVSRHEFGGAFDVRILSHHEADDDTAYHVLADLAPDNGLRAGYYFGAQGYEKDPFHFEIAESLSAAKAAWAAFVDTLPGGDPNDSAPPLAAQRAWADPLPTAGAFGMVAVGLGAFVALRALRIL